MAGFFWHDFESQQEFLLAEACNISLYIKIRRQNPKTTTGTASL
jgi:hypothetical protein